MISRTDPTDRTDHAVVLGGSVAGILAARVLADRFHRVTVVDRDAFPAPGQRRRGVPQDRHIHALWPAGRRVMEQLFPGLTEDLVARGARLGDAGRTATWCFGGTRVRAVDAGLELLCVSRPLLEGALRQRLAAHPAVTVRERCDARGLRFDDDRVVATRILPRADGSSEERLPADLVVDATGRASRLPRWLADAGYPAPRPEESGLEVRYTTMRFPRLPTDPVNAMIIAAVPPSPRGGGAIAVEEDAWVVTLGGVAGDHAPTDLDGFRSYASDLAIADLHEIVRDRQPLGPAAEMRFPTGRRLRYDELDRFPDGLVVTGDALCSFNPVYGQGMSVAAKEAIALGDALASGTHRIGQRFLAAVQALVDDAWAMAVRGDARFTAPDGPPPTPEAVAAARYMAALTVATGSDATVARTFIEVMSMARPSTALQSPEIAERIHADLAAGAG